MEPQTAEPLAAIPNQKHVELDFNPTVQKAEEPGVEIEKAPSPNTGIMALGISDLPDDTPTPREVKTLIASSSQEPAKASRFNKHGMLLFMLFAALITLFGSIGVGASLWFEITSQRPPAVTFLPPTADSNVTVTSTLVPVPSSYPMIATQYTGTLYDIPTHTTISISLSHIQQRQGSFSGYLKGMPTSSALNGILQNDPFTGTINAAKQIQFVVVNTKGGTAFIFDGAIQLDRTIVGTYCNHRSAQGNCIDYGLWSISPAT